jgi:hypothetical protein
MDEPAMRDGKLLPAILAKLPVGSYQTFSYKCRGHLLAHPVGSPRLSGKPYFWTIKLHTKGRSRIVYILSSVELET